MRELMEDGRPIAQLRSDIESRVRNVEGTAGSVANGNLAAIGAS